MNPYNIGRCLMCLGCICIYSVDGFKIKDAKEIKVSADDEICNDEDSEQPAEMVCVDEDHVIHLANVSYKACNQSPCIRTNVPVDKWPTGLLQCLGKFECKVLPLEPTPEFRVCASCSRSVFAPARGLMHLFCNGVGDVIEVKTSVSWSLDITSQSVHISDNSEGSRLAALKHSCDGIQYCNSINARPETGNYERVFYKCVQDKTTTSFQATVSMPTTLTQLPWKIPVIFTLGLVITGLLLVGGIGLFILYRRWYNDTNNPRDQELGANQRTGEDNILLNGQHLEQQ
ncbi:unnamed protein product [Owenia fusiformis]|uniref:Uncharacterized protein n=1 Tax=Owenia fusiformis TaxID=6347 RepID=A0A8J1Y6Q0_OWEFU|nr:unnamed protein product [Owenia fusiformis]